MTQKRPLPEPVVDRRTRILRWLFVFYLLGTIVVSLTKGDLVPNSSFQHMDKVGHFIAYTGLGFLVGLTFPGKSSRLLALFGVIALGFLLEWGQSFVPGRMMSLADGLANTCGVFLGFFLYQIRGNSVLSLLDAYLIRRE